MSKLCSVEVCDRNSMVKGLCGTHYAASRRGQKLHSPIRKCKNSRAKCSISGCEDIHAAKSFCRKHYHRNKRRNRIKELVEAFGDKCERCLISYPLEVYDFHHVDRSSKVEIIGSLLDKASMDALWGEALKCELLCANCHRIVEKEING